MIAVDPAGTTCDVPALLTDKLPGRPPAPDASDAFLRQLAEALPLVHRVDGDARARLPAYERYYATFDPRLVAAVPPAWSRSPDLWAEALALAREEPSSRLEGFIHRDYHPGNTLWHGDRLTGVVDWTQASWGPLAVDTAHMRWNLALDYGLEAADRFLAHHQDLAGPLDDQRYRDAVTVLDALPDLDPDDLPPAADVTRLDHYLEMVLT